MHLTDPDNSPIIQPIYQTSKFSLPGIADLMALFKGKRKGYLYSRFSNPTVRELEVKLAKMQGVEDAICCASGVAAISSTLFSCLKAGDKMLMFIESYKPSRYLARHFLEKFGVQVILASLRDEKLDELVEAEKPNLVLFESPTNPSLFLADIDKITEAARKVGALCVLDNTFAGLDEHHDCGVDVYIHSLSKQASGHGDVIAGAVMASADWISRHRNDFVQLGACMDPNTAFLVLRGLKTYNLRANAQSAHALAVAQFMDAQHEDFGNLRYPGLPSHPQYELAQRQLRSSGYVISADLVGGEKRFERFVSRLRRFHLTGSLGSTESLIAPSMLFYGGEMPEDDMKRSGISPTSFRLSVGLEDPQVLTADLQQALAGSRA